MNYYSLVTDQEGVAVAGNAKEIRKWMENNWDVDFTSTEMVCLDGTTYTLDTDKLPILHECGWGHIALLQGPPTLMQLSEEQRQLLGKEWFACLREGDDRY